MNDLFRFNWQAFDTASGIKVSLGAIVIFALAAMTGEDWTATSFVVLFVWLTNIPGALKDRIGGMLAFGAGAIAVTFLSGQMGLDLWPNVIAIAIIGFLGTVAFVWGMRAYMVGYMIICWAIYGPFLVSSTSVTNCVLAILLGIGIVIVLNVIGSYFDKDKGAEASTDAAPAAADDSPAGPSFDVVVSFSITVALVLALTTYLGWVTLKTDPTMVVAGAFFVIGFDSNKTWVAGIARVIGILAGITLGLFVSQLVSPGLLLDAIAVVAFFLCFAAAPVHPGFLMFFLLFILALGWAGLDTETLDLTFWERFLGEGIGVVIAMAAIGFLQWRHDRAAG